MSNRTVSIIRKIILSIAAVLAIVAFVLFIRQHKPGEDVSEEIKGSGPVHVSFAVTEDDADCILICQEDAALMIDTGEEQDSQSVLAMLDEYGVKELDCLILTHGDKDHVGGVEAVTSHVAVRKAIVPYYLGDHGWDEAIYCLRRNKTETLNISENKTLQIGTMKVTVYPGEERQYENENNNSLAVLVSDQNVNMLFTGDALKKRSRELEKITWPEIALYKVPHHGRANSRSEELFKLVNPEYAVVTSDGCDREIEDVATQLGTKLLFTRNEPVRFISDGEHLQQEQLRKSP